METVSIIIISALAALLAVAAVLAIVAHSRNRKISAALDEAAAKIADLDSAKESLTAEKADLIAGKAALEARLAAQEIAQQRIDEERAKAEAARKEQAAQEIANLKDAFRALSAENSDSFKKQSAETIQELLKPIQEKFGEFDKSVRESREKSVAQSASMETLIKEVMDRSKTVGEEARNLANALTGYSKVQGDFGEMLLTDVLKNSGLQEGVHFTTQGVIRDANGHEIKSESGATLIPDVMVFYPDDTTVIIDSKVSLNAYSAYMNAETIEERQRLAKEHVESVRKHVDELKSKDYASYIPENRRKVNYNIMFIPMEGAFRLMLEEAPLLWQVAKDNNVLIVSQMTLMIVLNMIQMSWKQYSQEKNIEEVYKTAEELMSQLKNWMEAYVKVGEGLSKAASAYEDSKKKLIESNQSVVKKIDKLEKLGLSPKRSNAKIKAGGRMVTGHESVIPRELSDGIDETQDKI